jgi:DNA-binding Lrp family transcriptional regulator
LGISDFEVLARLVEAPQRHARAQELAEQVHLSQSALSRLVDRLARHGLVARFTCDMDRRGIFVELTEAGLRRYAEAAPTHREILARNLPPEALPPEALPPEALPSETRAPQVRAIEALPAEEVPPAAVTSTTAS